MRTSRVFFFVLGAAAIAVGYACGGDEPAADPGAADGGSSSSSGSSGTGSSGSSGASSSGGSGDGGPTGPGCGAAACTGTAGMCGTLTDACGQKVECEPCRWSREPVAALSQVEHLAMASTGPGAWVFASNANGIISYWTKGAGGWQSERVAPDPEASAYGNVFDLHMALAPDGTPWLTFVHNDSGYRLVVAHRTNGTWTVETIGYATQSSIAVASDGTPYVAYVGSINDLASGTHGAVAARRTGGQWNDRTLLSQSNFVRDVSIALSGTEARVVWYDSSAMAVRYGAGMPGAGMFTAEDVATNVSSSGTNIEVDIALDAAGKSRVVYAPYSQGAKFAVRDPAWTVDPSYTGYRGWVRLANLLNDGVAIAMLGGSADSLSVSFRHGEWSTQVLESNCDNSAAMDMTVDSAGTTAIVHTCKYDNIEIWTQTSIYPAGYKAACDALGQALCTPACACPRADDGKCCIFSGGSSRCTGPASACPQSWRERYCGNATIDPAHVFACQAAAPTTMCNPDGGVGAIEPDACAPLRE